MSDEKQYRVYLCGGSSCTACGRDALLRVLEDELWAWELESEVEVYVSGCQDHCDYSPNLKIWPGPYQYKALTTEAIKKIVEQHLLNNTPVAEHLADSSHRR
ncbi:MAG: (2Fe-2S) ferredoxin domain-containing protein [Chloroflexi bacterium AL-W]|nr:(2Fe-2S) ferredoxin domain-containing protein [Chloroflexi bacterium AL-N1]NOK65060.1 (2Fe-2S) ferredoxin domain-containing protein [Chloroflexi bacterium AL-N10]NOK72673.1 (2Fe-2S) ferredoxin domain-containing protein [Chloroflexi bacterium AL-N5]NOK79239.1 (2Fe-2S) ferredoxin domain-containing protein [Chloroflexi bacterium AL-W]NOK87155.1 (2Fe-2S) ferredoxin domain-containing protein [Chloroflexi bacterium AL-N15]